MFLISNFRRVAFFLLGDSPASEFCDDVSEHPVSSVSIGGVFFLLTPPMKMELTECSETSLQNSDAGDSPNRKKTTGFYVIVFVPCT